MIYVLTVIFTLSPGGSPIISQYIATSETECRDQAVIETMKAGTIHAVCSAVRDVAA